MKTTEAKATEYRGWKVNTFKSPSGTTMYSARKNALRLTAASRVEIERRIDKVEQTIQSNQPDLKFMTDGTPMYPTWNRDGVKIWVTIPEDDDRQASAAPRQMTREEREAKDKADREAKWNARVEAIASRLTELNGLWHANRENLRMGYSEKTSARLIHDAVDYFLAHKS